jgi:hypothetical protein
MPHFSGAPASPPSPDATAADASGELQRVGEGLPDGVPEGVLDGVLEGVLEGALLM